MSSMASAPSRAGETTFKRATAHAFYRMLARATDVDIPLDAGDFRLMSRRALDALLAMPEQARFIRGMVAWIGFRQVPFAYKRDERFAGTTKYPLRKMIRFALDALTGFSSAPLKLASHAGLWLAVGSLLVMIYILAGWMSGRAIPGWTSLMFVVVVIGAVQMFVLGADGRIYRPPLQPGEATAALHRAGHRGPRHGRGSAPRPVPGHHRLSERSSSGEARRSSAASAPDWEESATSSGPPSRSTNNHTQKLLST